MKLKRLVVGKGKTNGYILYDEREQKAFIIDPGDEPKTFIIFIEEHSLKPMGIILTHYHYDHIGAVEELKEKYKCPVCIHKKDVEGLRDPHINYSMKYFKKPISIEPDIILLDGDMLQAGEITIEIIHTPGHTPGGICLHVKNNGWMFTGDTIFKDEIGRMDLEGGSEEDMKRVLINKVSKWPDNLMIYSGHGEVATMEYVKRKNKEYLYMI